MVGGGCYDDNFEAEANRGAKAVDTILARAGKKRLESEYSNPINSQENQPNE
jgi:hypothetical protein